MPEVGDRLDGGEQLGMTWLGVLAGGRADFESEGNELVSGGDLDDDLA